MPAAIEVSELRKRYGDHVAVDGVSFTVEQGETFGILGPNGAGKTTTLEMIEGLRKPDSGDVRLLDQPVWPDPRSIQPRIGVQLQSTQLFEALSARELLTLFANFYQRENPEQMADRALARVGLESKEGGEADTLSGGQKQRLAIALALVHEPEVVFLDEPTTGLDPQARRNLWDVIRSIAADDGRTVVLTTHYLEEAEALADRIAIMHEGVVAVTGTLAEIVSAEPARFSAAVPATAELPALSGAVEHDGDRLTVRTDRLQEDLTAFLTWAGDRGVRLTDLRAAPASLADIYHAIRMEQR